jgi:signal transduction histidine kinase
MNKMNASLPLGTDVLTKQHGRLPHPRLILPLGVSLLAFTIDLATPNGMLDGFLYVLAVLVCVWVPGVTVALYTALGLMPLMILAAFASPDGVSAQVASINVLAGIGTIWVAAIIVWHNACATRDREALLRQVRTLHQTTATAADIERIELSRWLHEGIGQELTAVGWGLDHIARHAGDEQEVRTEVQETRVIVDGMQLTMRAKAASLRHAEIDSGNLAALVEHHVAGFSARTEVAARLIGGNDLARVPDSHADLCFRVVQEALTNVAKHARATRVAIEVLPQGNRIFVRITDDGGGIAPADRLKPGSLGLIGLRERLVAIGGDLLVSNVSPNGARIEAEIPLPPG